MLQLKKEKGDGFMVARDFREKARDSLCGNWGIAVLVGFVASVLGASMYESVPTYVIEKFNERADLLGMLQSEHRTAFLSMVGSASLWGLIIFVIGELLHWDMPDLI